MTLALALARRPAAANAFMLGASVLTGAVLLRSRPACFAAFSWWVWIVAPELRRVVDFYGGAYNRTNPLVLSPLLVTALVAGPIVRHLPRLRRRSLFPFAVAQTGLLLGFCVGFVRVEPPAAVYALMSWSAPLLFGLWLALEWPRYSEIRDAMLDTFVLALPILGAYGVFQFVSPPGWDRSWMIWSKMNSIGRPFPFQVRVFSLSNSPGALAAVLAVTLLLVTGSRRPGRGAAVCGGIAALLLSLVRASWLGAVVGGVVLATQATRQALRRYVLTAVALAAGISGAVVVGYAVLPSTAVMRVTDILGRRLTSLGDLAQDRSYVERSQIINRALEQIGSHPLGLGLGATGVGARLGPQGGIEAFDNGLLDVVYSLGWFGAALFYGGILAVTLRQTTPRAEVAAGDGTPAAARAALAATAVQLLSGNQFWNVMGAAFWTAAGLLAASRMWYAARDARE